MYNLPCNPCHLNGLPNANWAVVREFLLSRQSWMKRELRRCCNLYFDPNIRRLLNTAVHYTATYVMTIYQQPILTIIHSSRDDVASIETGTFVSRARFTGSLSAPGIPSIRWSLFVPKAGQVTASAAWSWEFWDSPPTFVRRHLMGSLFLGIF